jgi:hypothetical protein
MSEDGPKEGVVSRDNATPGVLPPAAPLQFGQFSPELPELSYCFLDIAPGSFYDFSSQDFLLIVSFVLDSFISGATKRISTVPAKQKYSADPADLAALSKIVDMARACAESKNNSFSTESPGKVEIRVVLIGGNFVVNRFLCAYVSWCHSNKSSANAIEWNIYVVPSERNDLATFLAHSDRWYRRHVYFPFVGPLALCPQV